jgi:hypothetical protein
MLEYREVATSREVAAVIHARHGDDLVVHASFSDPTGDSPLGNGRPKMDTWWGFRKADCPIYHSRNTWDKEVLGTKDHARHNEKFEYWLCLPIEEE